MKSLFSGGYRGLSDTIFSGVRGSVYRSVGIDHRSKPGVLKAHQRLIKVSGSVVDNLCQSGVTLKDGKKVWFGGPKAYLDNAGTFSERMAFSSIPRDVLFTDQTNTFLGEVSSFIRFNGNGTIAYVSSTSTESIRQYQLAEAYNLNTASLVHTRFIAHSSFWVTDNRLFILESNLVRVFAISKGSIASTEQVTTWSISAQTTTATDISFNTAGTQLFIMQANGTVFTYTLSVAFGQNMPSFRMLAVAGGGGGGSSQASGSGDEIRGGGGGGGGVWEGFEEWLLASNTYNITVGAGGDGGGGPGVTGADTVAFSKTLKGGGGGGQTVSTNIPLDNAGLPGGSGGGGGRDDQSSGPDTNGPGGAALNTGTYQQTGTRGSLVTSGGLAWVSDISGASVTYSPQTGASPTANTVGANGTIAGAGGEGGFSAGASIARAGGNGFRGVCILRFITANVAYSHTGGTVTTSGADTIITWTTTGTFSHTVTTPFTFASSQTFPVARGFAVESGRVLFTSGDQVTQYTMTAFDFATAVLSDNILATNTELAESVTPRGLFLTPDALFVSYETGAKKTRLSVSKHTFVTSTSNIVNAQVVTVSVPNKAKAKKLYDSVGATESRGQSITGYNGTAATVVLNTDKLLDIPLRNSLSGASFVRAFLSTDPTQRLRGYATSKSLNTITVSVDDDVDTDNSIIFDTVAGDAIILQESIGRSLYDGQDIMIQPITLTRDTTLNLVKVKFREGHGINGGYTIKFDIKLGSTVVATNTVTIGADDIGISEALVDFSFTPVTLMAGVKYTFEVSIPSVASFSFNRQQNRYVVCPVKTRTVADLPITVSLHDIEMQLQMFNTAIVETEAEDISEERIYFATNKLLFYIKASDVASLWAGKVRVVGEFKNGSDIHPMAIQNLSLFIGDDYNIAEINRFGTFTKETNLNVPKGEIITALVSFDIDVLIGTQAKDYGRVLRWDGLSESWSAEDTVYQEGGVRAFISDDNFVYPVVGNRGSIYYYNGASCEDFVTVPEVYDQNSIKVNNNAVGYFRGTPLVGVSNLVGNPVLQGVYGYGSYNSNYAKSLSLDFPMPSGQFAGVEIGVILTEGNDLYVAWRDGTDTGVAQIDWSNKYVSSYLETITLTQAMNRHQAKTVSDVIVPYHTLPTNTAVTVGVNKDYSATFTTMAVLVDSVRRVIKLKSPSVPESVNPRLRIGLTVSGNTTPEIEDVVFTIAGVEIK